MPLVIAILIYFGLLSGVPIHAQACDETFQQHAQSFFAEVSGDSQYQNVIPDLGILFLEKVDYGWAIRIYDDDRNDLTRLTPPQHFGNNPRNILGWHFRNADNTMMNDGSVNSAQEQRDFNFETDSQLGQGRIQILDYGLADLQPQKKSRMVYLKVQGCLTWDRTVEEQFEYDNFHSPVFVDEELDIIRSCGLNQSYQPEAFITPRWLGGDFDNDGAGDDVVPIVRVSDQKKGIALCRAGTWLNVMDFGERSFFEADYLSRVEAWSVISSNEAKDIQMRSLLSEPQGDVVLAH